jgi:hypothetical protein
MEAVETQDYHPDNHKEKTEKNKDAAKIRHTVTSR